jgi:hypothetical protein
LERIAQCQCGGLQVRVASEPVRVLVCHCHGCQRRTGSAFGLSAYFPKSDAVISGRSSAWSRTGATGKEFAAYFCPTCGTSLYWFLAADPDMIGIAAGAFADANFPGPSASYWEDRAHPWVHIDGASMRERRQ